MKKTTTKAILAVLVVFVPIILIGVGNDWFGPKEERIVALGDSLTYGIGDDSGQGYVENLKQWFETNGEDVKVDNYGIPDQQTDGMLTQMNDPEVLKSLQKADYILLFIGTNDLIESNGGDLSEINKEAIAAGKKDYVKNLKSILKTVRGSNGDAPILFLGLYNPYPNNGKIDEIIKEWNSTSKGLIDSYTGITFVETNDLFEEKTTRIFSDELHLNEKGYERLTKRIIQAYDFDE
ncbi:GDSL-type esterase/lipase family protein [Halobacillus sp. ACCC02827]|uniref:GDSL-type esterase/lipase family protein n=1 Tax=Halobacillus sp. ACCC02827 TaxID=3052090 RepID=UPI00257057C0|nr:GDSL-type esterase/lipase family protein [Halobacillus sp. ACCC02827]WJE14214.1 GDSL-type esterase/lipase family protein [Halobacillus sp. ACCC02827]